MTLANDGFKSDCERLLAKRVFRDTPSPWTFNHLVDTVRQVAGIAAAAGESEQGDHWTVLTARLVSIFRHEQYKARRIDDWNREQERKNK